MVKLATSALWVMVNLNCHRSAKDIPWRHSWISNCSPISLQQKRMNSTSALWFMAAVMALLKICRGDIPDFLIVPPSPFNNWKEWILCLRRRCSKPSDGLYKWFRRVRGPAAMQAMNSMYLFNFTKRFAAFDKGSIPSRILSSAFKMWWEKNCHHQLVLSATIL